MLYIKKSGLPGSGKGLFTDSFIPKGTKVVEYTGEIITMKEYESRTDDDRYGYMLYFNKNHCIDAYRRPKALARYANDAKGLFGKKGLFNNCMYDFYGKRGYIVAFRNILPHCEILVGYGKEYWDDMRYNIRIDRQRALRKKRKRLEAKAKAKTKSKIKTKKKRR